MSLLETITKAAADLSCANSVSDYPIVLDSETAFLTLKPENENEVPLDEIFVKQAKGWKISDSDVEIIELGQSFSKKLRMKMKKRNALAKDEFVEIFSVYLNNLGEKKGVSVEMEDSIDMHCCKLIENVGSYVGRDVRGLLVEACIKLDLWEFLDSFIVYGLVEPSSQSVLINNLLEKRRSDLIISCVKHFSDLQSYGSMCILKFFLCPPKNGIGSMLSVKKEWDSQALLVIEKVSSSKLSPKKMTVAKDASMWLMLAHDGFSVSELCLHHFFASKNLDEVILASCISKLNGVEMTSLIRYLSKWLSKYDRFPQVVPCRKASSVLELKACDWIPSLEVIVKCLGLVVDEHFSSLVLHTEFHEELRTLDELVNSLAAEARLCGSVANLAERLRSDRLCGSVANLAELLRSDY